MNEELLNLNFVLYTDYLKKYDCFSQSLIDEYGERLKVASFGMDTKFGSAYVGSLIDIILKRLCVIGIHINECAFGLNSKGNDKHPFLKCDKNSLMKVLLLQHISKCDMFVETNESWKRNKGFLYEFNPKNSTCLKLGERSLFMCQKHNIMFTEEEYDAMLSSDREDSDRKASTLNNPLSEVVSITNRLSNIEMFRITNKVNNL